MTEKITVIDSIMGTGKTSWAIQEINAHPETSFIYCTPFLKEIGRVQESCNRKLCDPQKINGRKIEGFNHLLMSGRDIALTHATFSNANVETLEYLEKGNYCLILDEVLDILINFNDVACNKITKADIPLLFNEGFITTDEYGQVEWLKGSYPGAKYSDVERLAKNGNLFYLDKTMLVWRFPPRIFKLFKKVYVMTYLFQGSYLKPYFEYHGLQYDLASIGKNEAGLYELIPYTTSVEERRRIKDMITIHDHPKMNDYKASSLCSTWYQNANREVLQKLQRNIFNYFHNVTKAKSSEIVWTCPKDYKSALKGKGYTAVRRLTQDEKKLPAEELKELEDKNRCHLPCNMRASNDYRDRSVLVYAFNMFPNPYVERYFTNKNQKDGTNIGIDKDYLALGCMLQWIWRSCIRDNKPIKIYIPSTRMRTLFINWLDGKM